MLPLNQSRKIALIAVGLFVVSISILFTVTQKSSFMSGDLKAQIFGSTATHEQAPETSSDPVVVIQTDNKVTYASPSFKTALGYTDESLKDADFFGLVHSGDAGEVAKFITKIVQDHNEMKNLGPYRIKGSDGQYKVYMANATVKMSAGKVTQIVITMKDITKSVEQINNDEQTGKPIRTMKNDPDKKVMASKV
ncbi:MAG: Sporulation kinase E [Candidatus Peregrinibacteria bacterium GW2011_GWA2_38_36]|nr:MAG: Sporulation kinase E [Candidatus Peregrinibacteria bacterium GW2011_GWA2_38_36]